MRTRMKRVRAAQPGTGWRKTRIMKRMWRIKRMKRVMSVKRVRKMKRISLPSTADNMGYNRKTEDREQPERCKEQTYGLR